VYILAWVLVRKTSIGLFIDSWAQLKINLLQRH
jgi:hypothetical protein